MKRIQISHNIVDKDILDELKKYMLAPWQKILLFCTAVIAIVFAGIDMYLQEYVISIVLIALAILCIVEMFWLRERKIKKLKKEMEDEGHIYILNFIDDGLTIHNSTTASDEKMLYSTMKRIVETQNTYTIFGRGNHFAVIRKDVLKIKPEQLVDFLKSKDTKIKKWI